MSDKTDGLECPRPVSADESTKRSFAKAEGMPLIGTEKNTLVIRPSREVFFMSELEDEISTKRRQGLEGFVTNETDEVVFDLTRIVDFETFTFLSLLHLLRRMKKELSFLAKTPRIAVELAEEHDVAGLKRVKNQLFYALKQSGLISLLEKETTVRFKQQRFSSNDYDKIRRSLRMFWDRKLTSQYKTFEIKDCALPRERLDSILRGLKADLESFLETHVQSNLSDDTRKVSDIIIQELSDNVYAHNSEIPDLNGYVWVRYHKRDSDLIPAVDRFSPLQTYFSEFAPYDFIEISVSDNGLGLHRTLEGKIETPYGLSSPETLLQTAFRLERGLFKVKEFLKVWGGIALFRMGRMQYAFGYSINGQETAGLGLSQIELPIVRGTHVQVLIPAVLGKMRSASNTVVSPKQTSLFMQPEEEPPTKIEIEMIEISPDLTQEKAVTTLIDSIKKKIGEAEIKGRARVFLDFSLFVQFESSLIKERLLLEFFSGLYENVGKDRIAKILSVVGFPPHRVQQILSSLARFDKPVLLIDYDDKIHFIGIRKESATCWLLGKIVEHGVLNEQDIGSLRNASPEPRIDLNAVELTKRAIERGEFSLFSSYQIGRTRHYRYEAPNLTQNFLTELRKLCTDTKAVGHFRLFSGKHSNLFVESRLLLEQTRIVRGIARLIAKRVTEPPQVIVSYSITGAILVYNLIRYFFRNSEMVICSDYDNVEPKIGEDVDLVGKTVMIVTDVVSDGKLVQGIADFVSARGGRIVEIAGILGASEVPPAVSLPTKPISPSLLTTFPVERVLPGDCEQCEGNVPLTEIDRFSMSPLWTSVPESREVATDSEEKPSYVKPRERQIFGTVRSEMEQIGDWLDLLELDPTVFEERHTVRGKNHFTHYCYTERILASLQTRRVIESTVSKLFSSANFRITTLVHPANLGATLLAQVIVTRLPYHTRVVSLPSRSLQKPPRGPRSFRPAMQGGDILLVDDSANSGDTLLSMMTFLNQQGCSPCGAFVLIDRLSSEARDRFKQAQFEVSSVLRVNVPSYAKESCPLCRESDRLKSELNSCFDDGYRHYLAGRIADLEPVVFSIYGDRVMSADDLAKGKAGF